MVNYQFTGYYCGIVHAADIDQARFPEGVQISKIVERVHCAILDQQGTYGERKSRSRTSAYNSCITCYCINIEQGGEISRCRNGNVEIAFNDVAKSQVFECLSCTNVSPVAIFRSK